MTGKATNASPPLRRSARRSGTSGSGPLQQEPSRDEESRGDEPLGGRQTAGRQEITPLHGPSFQAADRQEVTPLHGPSLHGFLKKRVNIHEVVDGTEPEGAGDSGQLPLFGYVGALGSAHLDMKLWREAQLAAGVPISTEPWPTLDPKGKGYKTPTHWPGEWPSATHDMFDMSCQLVDWLLKCLGSCRVAGMSPAGAWELIITSLSSPAHQSLIRRNLSLHQIDATNDNVDALYTVILAVLNHHLPTTVAARQHMDRLRMTDGESCIEFYARVLNAASLIVNAIDYDEGPGTKLLTREVQAAFVNGIQHRAYKTGWQTDVPRGKPHPRDGYSHYTSLWELVWTNFMVTEGPATPTPPTKGLVAAASQPVIANRVSNLGQGRDPPEDAPSLSTQVASLKDQLSQVTTLLTKRRQFPSGPHDARPQKRVDRPQRDYTDDETKQYKEHLRILDEARDPNCSPWDSLDAKIRGQIRAVLRAVRAARKKSPDNFANIDQDQGVKAARAAALKAAGDKKILICAACPGYGHDTLKGKCPHGTR